MIILPIPTELLIQGSVGLMVFGSAFGFIKTVPARLINYTSSKLFVSCAVDNEDSIYQWLSLWLATLPEMQRTGALRVSSYDLTGDDERKAVLAPGDGEHTFVYDGTRFWVSITSAEPGQASYHRSRTIRIRCRLRKRANLERLLSSVLEHQRNPDPTVTKLFIADGSAWMLHGRKPIRAYESLILDGDLLESITTDARKFIAERETYMRLGIPHRRGYLLSGPPGNGKTSLALALAGILGVPLYVLSLGDPLMTDDRLRALLGSVPGSAIVTAEDVDTVFCGREREAENKLTFSGLLNAVDGSLSSEGRILILTSNRPEVLDPALIRPGRVDRHVVLENATTDQARRMWQRFGRSDGEADFVAWASDGTQSMASLQAHLIKDL